MKKLFLVMAMFLFNAAGTAQAAKDYGLELGARQQSGNVAGASISTNSKTGMQFGGYYHHPLEGGVAHFRTGLLYTQRPIESENDITGAKVQYNLDYLDIPVDIMFKPSESVGFYLGFNVAINITKSCTGDVTCKVNSVNTPLFPFVFGVMFNFTPKWGLDFYVDGANSNVAKGLYDYRAVGLNLTYSLQ
ncbi:outer membrane beta-barrel protein [Bdellovibrio svalbardensis]|uniref:Porin family protein n=1 Tax=Bdellovibrio svalbardensis TaxID=2972972 RepID=A0ABT6DJP9_9BACT|nr:outer membrane beta-barrel protein [Bdellovibrio svalbardensis]MDG0815313.1 porin family protein [Bdellovibrio svalbardensis]